jgi:hypothetical protein
MHALVNGTTGTIVRGSGATSVARSGAGRYEVFWNRDVDTCSWHVTLVQLDAATLSEGNNGEPSTYTILGANGNDTPVSTFNSAGVESDRNFFISVLCSS